MTTPIPPLGRLRDTKSAAAYLDTSPGNLKLSRHTGLLWGLPAPKHIKTPGGLVRYDVRDLDDFVEGLSKFRNTAEVNVSA
jgi:hypothetical protein